MADDTKTVELSKEEKTVIDAVEKLNVVQLNNVVKFMEEEYGISTAAPVAVGAPAAGGDEGGADEKSNYDVEITAAGDQKIAAIKAVREITGLPLGEAKAAVSQGATIYEQSPVLRIEKNSKPVVVTEHGSVTSDFVVLAGNTYHFLERKLQGIMFPVNSFIIASEPLSPALVSEINPQDLAVCDPNYILEYFRLSADKRLLFGGRCNYFGSDPEVIKRQLMPRMLRIYPQLAGINFEFAWGGTIGVPINRVPQMGRIANNIVYSQGYSGHGVNVTHLAGQIMADTVAGTLERFDIFADIEPFTIPGQRLFGRQMVALGMLYYKLKDKL